MAVIFKNRSPKPPAEPAPAVAASVEAIPVASASVPPPPDAEPYTILVALKELAAGTKHKGETLMLVHNLNGSGYRVLRYDPVTGIATLKGSNGQQLQPRISARECAIYSPVWR